MQSMLNDCLNDGADFAVTVDFDSLFGAHHIKRLLSVIAANPHIDALASFQARRGMKYPLFTVAGQGAVQFEGAPLQVTTAHFGLTAIRLKPRLRMWPSRGSRASLDSKLASTTKPALMTTFGFGGNGRRPASQCTLTVGAGSATLRKWWLTTHRKASIALLTRKTSLRRA
jgi:hypothetical protein